MSPSDPKRSKDITTPRGNASSVPSEKQPKKIEPTVLVAIISAIVTLVTAILSSPLILSLVKPDTTLVPSGAEMGMVPGLAENIPTEPVVVLASPTIGKSNDPAAPTATVSTQTLSPATDLPPAPENAVSTLAVPTAVSMPSFLTCFAESAWFPYPATLNPGMSNGCWNLVDWGFSMTGGQVSLLHNPEQDQQRGIYLPLSGDVVIQFAFQLNEFRTRSNKGGFLHFGIVQDDPFSNYAGGFLSYQQPSPGATSPVRALVSGTNQATETVMILEKGFQQTVVLSVVGDVLTVSLDGVPVGDPVTLPPTERAFWIGYVLPAKAELEANLIGLTVQAP